MQHYARSLLCSGHQTLLRLGSFFVPSSKLFPHLPTSRKHSSLVLTDFTKEIKKINVLLVLAMMARPLKTRTNIHISKPHWYVCIQLTVLTLIRVLCIILVFSLGYPPTRRSSDTSCTQPYHTPETQKDGGTVESTLLRWLTLRCPRSRHASWEGFQCALDPSAQQRTHTDRGEALCPHPSDFLCEASSSGPLPPEQPRVAIPLSQVPVFHAIVI